MARKKYICSVRGGGNVKRGLLVLLVLGVLFLASPAFAQRGEGGVIQKYGGAYEGVVETDMGSGEYTLVWDGRPFSGHTNAWGGAIAEFIHRHSGRRIVAIVDADRWNSGVWLVGVVLLKASE